MNIDWHQIKKSQADRFNRAVEEYAVALVAASWELYADRLREQARHADPLSAVAAADMDAARAAGEVAGALKKELERGREAKADGLRELMIKTETGDGDA